MMHAKRTVKDAIIQIKGRRLDDLDSAESHDDRAPHHADCLQAHATYREAGICQAHFVLRHCNDQLQARSNLSEAVRKKMLLIYAHVLQTSQQQSEDPAGASTAQAGAERLTVTHSKSARTT